ncbi:hypothetical protein Forpe1208_v001674 [Fusarium oxysporum f. sp. rapae]|uniref:Uncharacterized protein n=1 Tax=Fusarium oxysporum f. sp. rapae TaxID=485398 RepID=A0A8J5PBM5_FUSOX|nr:hypothetical protein Forpe1208_v001674 [Fusarium oxysporum f. sp. rapae]
MNGTLRHTSYPPKTLEVCIRSRRDPTGGAAPTESEFAQSMFEVISRASSALSFFIDNKTTGNAPHVDIPAHDEYANWV